MGNHRVWQAFGRRAVSLLTAASLFCGTAFGGIAFFAAAAHGAPAATPEAGKQYLADNAKRPGVVSLPSGLQYEILTVGTGPKPGLNDLVTTHYHGTLIDGSVFDSSVERGEPASFPVGGVIKGWVEALQLMPVGSKWRLFVPSELAYGKRGAGGAIGPDQVLVFDVELLSIAPR